MILIQTLADLPLKQKKSLSICKSLPCSNVNFTFPCKSIGSVSHIDHVLVSENLTQLVKGNITVDNIYNASDHVGVVTLFDIECEYHQKQLVDILICINDYLIENKIR